MQSVQQNSLPTFNEMLRMGIRANEIGMPQEWSSLIHKPIKRDLECTARLLAGIDKPKAQDYIVQLAKRDLSYVAAFFNSLRVPFFFFGWDRPRSAIVQCCGPDRRSVLALLNHQPVTQQPTAGPSNDRLNRVWQAVGIVLDELQFRDGISFSLSWNPHYGRIPEFDFSGYDRPVSWNALWQSLPLAERCRVSREPPPHHIEVEDRRLECALHPASTAIPQTSVKTRELP